MICLWRLVVTLLVAYLTTGDCKRIPQWQLKMVQRQGPNTCAVEEVPDTNKKFWTECKYWLNREICGAKTVIRYECCEGFHQVKDGGCFGVRPLQDVIRTARDLGATAFVDHLKEAGLAERLSQPGQAITLFAPTNEAFKRLSIDERQLLEHDGALLYHVVGGKKLHSRDFRGDQEVDTLHFGGHPLRINKYNHGMSTVNCAPMVRRDQQATNGVVHVIDGVLLPPPPPRPRKSLPEALLGDGRFREAARLMLESGFVNELRNKGPYTLLAPTDEAFQSLPRRQMARLRDDPEAIKALMRNHILPHVVCLPAVVDEHKMKTELGTRLRLHCNTSGVYVEDAKVANDQIFASNGVVTVVSKVLIPDRARSLLELMSGRLDRMSTFHRLLRSSDKMVDFLDSPNITVTVFAPSNEAFERMPEETFQELVDNPLLLESMLKYHIATGRVLTDGLSDGQRADSVDGDSSLRLSVYRKEVGVESAIIREADIEGQNGVVHIIDRVLAPPTRTALQLLQDNPQYSLMAEAVSRIQELEPEFLSGNGTLTLFAPSDDAFRKQLNEHELRALLKNRKKLRKMVQNHVVDNMVSTGSIHSRLQYDVRTEHQAVSVRKEGEGMMVNSAHVVEPDVVTTDGIVHCIDRVLLPAHRRRKA